MKTIIKTIFIFTLVFNITINYNYANQLQDINNVDNIDIQYIYETISETSNSYENNYLKKSISLKKEIDEINTKIKQISDYNYSVNNKLKIIEDKYKTDKSVISNENMKIIRELKKNLQNGKKKEKTITEDNSIKSFIQNKEYEKALNKLSEILSSKKEQLKILTDNNAIWHQIDAIIG